MYPVIWRDAAMDQLADAIVRSDLPTQDAIERSVLRLNARLAHDPFSAGESRSAGRRIAIELPVGILFRIDAPTQVAVVVAFWTC